MLCSICAMVTMLLLEMIVCDQNSYFKSDTEWHLQPGLQGICRGTNRSWDYWYMQSDRWLDTYFADHLHYKLLMAWRSIRQALCACSSAPCADCLYLAMGHITGFLWSSS